MSQRDDCSTPVGRMKRLSENTSSIKPFPWFGMDIGGSLTKLVYFEPDLNWNVLNCPESTIRNINRYLTSSVAYGSTGIRETKLEMKNQVLCGQKGTLHFIQFPTAQVGSFLQMAKQKNLNDLAEIISATGSGAYRFSQDFHEIIGMRLIKNDETHCLMLGLHYALRSSATECFYLELEAPTTKKTASLQQEEVTEQDDQKQQQQHCHPSSNLDSIKYEKLIFSELSSSPYPMLIVNIGAGVSVIAAHSPTQFKRVSGSSLGGATFMGLINVMLAALPPRKQTTEENNSKSEKEEKQNQGGAPPHSRVDCFSEALEMASRGNSHNVDKLVRDIYGGDYGKFGLKGDIVASSFGKLVGHNQIARMQQQDEQQRDLENANSSQTDVLPCVSSTKSCDSSSGNSTPTSSSNSSSSSVFHAEDLVKAALLLITNNIGSIANLCAKSEQIDRVLFVGNFLDNNSLSMALLARSMLFWTNGQTRALFLEHEGYFGAIGSLLQLLDPQLSEAEHEASTAAAGAPEN